MALHDTVRITQIYIFCKPAFSNKENMQRHQWQHLYAPVSMPHVQIECLLYNDHTISYMCAKSFTPNMPKSCKWSEHAGVGSSESTLEGLPENSRRTPCRNNPDFSGAWQLWAFGIPFWFCMIGWSCRNCWYFSKLPLRLIHLSPDRIKSQRQTDRFVLLCDAHGSFHFGRSATNTAKKLPACVVRKRGSGKRCRNLLRTVRLFAVSYENADI